MKVGHAKRLDEQDHRSLVLWAAGCAEHVLPYFEEKYPKDDRPRKALEAGRAWVRGGIAMNEARAAATAHVAGHARHAAAYAVIAATAAATERDWQCRRLPKHLRPIAFPARGKG